MVDKPADSPDFGQDENYDKVHRATWIRRVAGMLTGITVFGVLGAIGGAIAAFAPYVIGALGVAGASPIAISSAVAAIPSTAALFAGAFALLGMVIGTDVGANAGSVAAGLSKKETREALEQGKDLLPPAEKKKESIAYSPRVALFTVPMGIAFGALLAFTGLAPAVALLGFAAATPAATVASAVTFGLFGASIGFNVPVFSNKLSNFYSRMITDRLLVSDPAKPLQVVESHSQFAEAGIDEPTRSKSFAADAPRFSLQDIVERNEKRSPDQDTVLAR